MKKLTGTLLAVVIEWIQDTELRFLSTTEISLCGIQIGTQDHNGNLMLSPRCGGSTSTPFSITSEAGEAIEAIRSMKIPAPQVLSS